MVLLLLNLGIHSLWPVQWILQLLFQLRLLNLGIVGYQLLLHWKLLLLIQFQRNCFVIFKLLSHQIYLLIKLVSKAIRELDSLTMMILPLQMPLTDLIFLGQARQWRLMLVRVPLKLLPLSQQDLLVQSLLVTFKSQIKLKQQIYLQ